MSSRVIPSVRRRRVEILFHKKDVDVCPPCICSLGVSSLSSLSLSLSLSLLVLVVMKSLNCCHVFLSCSLFSQRDVKAQRRNELQVVQGNVRSLMFFNDISANEMYSSDINIHSLSLEIQSMFSIL